MQSWDWAAAGLVGLMAALLAGKFIEALSGKAKLLIFSIAALAVVQGAATYAILPGALLRDTLLAPILGTRPAADRLANLYEKKILDDPLLGPQLKSLSTADRRQRMFTLTAHGMPRLDASWHEKRVALINRLLAVATVQECAALGRGKVTEAGLHTLMVKLSEPEVAQMHELSIAAARAEIGNQPYQKADDTELGAAVRELLSRLPPEDAQRFEREFPRMLFADDPDVCWMGKTLYGEVGNLSPPNRDALRQALSRWE
ncbi:MAG: hypothetical protein EPO61_04715 [Nitrospirae bacterium]|nr:MAG: hypothetical protein EPO61_04715 [Nitrospirota bacterium]